ncbi:hypothetical protein V6N11_047990 [Hibiscus sabdariffa]|uniref:DUF4283 domain-containing protein n=1 Tax=Hibiscus sabdariffa TaxID=183260 RepID=A0ABR2NXE7_9ROSI
MVDSEVVGGESKSPGSGEFDLSDFPPLPVANGNVVGVASVWINLWHIPLELFSQTCLGCLASAIGRPLYTDTATTLKQQLEFAKICVEVEAKSSLPNYVLVDLDEDNCIEVGVELVLAPIRCDHCCIFGHSGDKCTRKVVATGVVSDDYVVCDVLELIKVHFESEIAVETGVDEYLVSSGTMVESEVFAADGSESVETAMVKEGVDPLESMNGKEILVAPNRFDILDVVNHGEENCISPKKDIIVVVGVAELMSQLKPKAKGQGKKNKCVRQGSKKKGAQEKIAATELGDSCKAEERFLRQKSRIQFTKEGDQNSTYFFRQMAAKNRANTIHSLKNCHGDKLESLETISNELIQYVAGSLRAIDNNV